MLASHGGLYGNGKGGDYEAGRFGRGDRMGFLPDLDDSSLRFFKNGVEHAPRLPSRQCDGVGDTGDVHSPPL